MAVDRREDVSNLVGGRRYCFVIMPYRAFGLLYDHLREVIQEATALRCIRADEVPGANTLLDKIHALIEGAELVVAELSVESPNVYYEVGYAKASGKNVLVICQGGTKVPTDLQGLEKIEYVDTPLELPQFDAQLRRHLATMLDSDLRLLRDMLVAPDPYPSAILASPRWRVRDAMPNLKTQERRTYGDYLGVVGILYAWGALFGKEGLPDLLSAQHVNQAEVLGRDSNLYLIGSTRANALTGEGLAEIQQGVAEPWRFEEDTEGNTTALRGWVDGGPWEWKVTHDTNVPEKDYGVIVRGPRPSRPGRQIVVMAGTRSLGTGAACLAATRVRFIKEIQSRLRDAGLQEKGRTVWALVSGRPHPEDNHNYEDGVEVEAVGVVR